MKNNTACPAQARTFSAPNDFNNNRFALSLLVRLEDDHDRMEYNERFAWLVFPAILLLLLEVLLLGTRFRKIP